ncbi:unnamed protein product [Victoria cruziana]
MRVNTVRIVFYARNSRWTMEEVKLLQDIHHAIKNMKVVNRAVAGLRSSSKEDPTSYSRLHGLIIEIKKDAYFYDWKFPLCSTCIRTLTKGLTIDYVLQVLIIAAVLHFLFGRMFVGEIEGSTSELDVLC